METIKKRIEEIKKELDGFAQAINQHIDTLANLRVQFMKKQGALIERERELQDIIDADKKEKD